MDSFFSYMTSPAFPFKLWLALSLIVLPRIAAPRITRATMIVILGLFAVSYEAMIVGSWTVEAWLFHLIAVFGMATAVYFSVRKSTPA